MHRTRAAVSSGLATRSSQARRRSAHIAAPANDALQEVQKGDPGDQEEQDCETQDEGKQLIRHFRLLAMRDLGDDCNRTQRSPTNQIVKAPPNRPSRPQFLWAGEKILRRGLDLCCRGHRSHASSSEQARRSGIQFVHIGRRAIHANICPRSARLPALWGASPHPKTKRTRQ